MLQVVVQVRPADLPKCFEEGASIAPLSVVGPVPGFR